MKDQNSWQQRAVKYIREHARPLEAALYQLEFENGPVEAALEALADFQNDDGGFGHGLEPDIRLDDSSVIAATIAFQVFRRLTLPAETPMVEMAAEYLLANYDPDKHAWPVIPPNVDDAPHAPWWTNQDAPGGFQANPGAEIVGYFYDYPDLFPAVLRRALTVEALAWLEALTQSGAAIEMHDLLCCIRLAESESLPDETRARLVALLRPMITSAVAPDPAAWAEYGLTPLMVVSSPASPFYPGLAGLIPQNIDFILAGQNEDGSWSPNWNWAFASEDGWRMAACDWKGVLTLGNLRVLAAFGVGEA